MNDTTPKPETPALTRAGRKVADIALEAARFKPTVDGKHVVRHFEAYGMEVTEYASPDSVMSPGLPSRAPATQSNAANGSMPISVPETPPLSRQGRKIADQTLDTAIFAKTSDGKSVMRKFEVHGIAVTEYVSADQTVPSHIKSG